MQRGQLTLGEAALEDNTELSVEALQLNSDLRLFLPPILIARSSMMGGACLPIPP